MNAEEAVAVIRLGLGLIWLWFIYMAWRSYRAEALKDDLFAIRDRLFDYAATGGIEFDDPAYRRLWRLVNALIHYANRITFARFVVPAVITPVVEQDTAAYKEWRRSLQNASPEAREFLDGIDSEVTLTIAGHLVKRTIPLMPFVALTKLAYLLGRELPRAKNACVIWIETRMASLENRALEAEKHRQRRRRHYPEPHAMRA